MADLMGSGSQKQQDSVGICLSKADAGVSNLEPEKDRFCDLIMKGGITSGIVYPRAISLLSHYYRFRGIGGTSAGAIAAAITAAAEYQRRQEDGSRKGFDLLEELPAQLQAEVGKGKHRLFSLFQPQPGTQRLFKVLAASLNSGSTEKRWLNGLGGILAAYWPAAAISIVIACIIALNAGWFSAVLMLIMMWASIIGIWIYLDITREVVANGFGICTGMTVEKGTEALTPWLHRMIQSAAGRKQEDDPLTFGDLWEADGDFPPSWLTVPRRGNKRSIDLQMFSTNLSHGRPYVFPLAEAETGESRFRSRERLYFREEEMRKYLPPDVVEWMLKKSRAYIVEQGREGKDPSAEAAEGRRELPEAKDFPVLLAARMSLAFPFLISAVPLHAIDHDLLPGKRKFRRCWFSDGGVSSNFPIHLFDGLVPSWPTFGIDLEPAIEDRELFYLPSKYTAGYGECWNRFAENDGAVSKLGGFINAFMNAMQSWNDNSLRRMPGVRDRVARIRLCPGEGGMNLNMEPEIIERLAKRGEDAANELIQRYAIKLSDGSEATGWDEHRFVRFNNLLKMMKARLPALVEALSPDCRHATDLEKLVEKFASATDILGNEVSPPGYENLMTKEEQSAYARVITALGILADEISRQENNIPFKPIPIPEPELRMRPPL
jgi:predicted acylesterase/phospholipase RssA